MSVRRRRIKERLDRLRKQQEQKIDSDKFFSQVQSAIDHWRGKPFDLDDFLFDAFGPLGPPPRNTRSSHMSNTGWPTPSQHQMQFIYNVTREARIAGIDRRAFLAIVDIVWKEQQKAEDAMTAPSAPGDK